MRVPHEAVTTEDVRAQSRPGHGMPTLGACAAAAVALVVAVGFQAPAVSVGLRWTPGPRGKTLQLIEDDLGRIKLPIRDASPDTPWPLWVKWLLALAAAALLYAFARWLYRLTRRPPATTVARTGVDTGLPTEAEARILQSGLAAAIEILSSERDFSNVVIQAWQGLQDAAATAGLHRRPAETASEFTARILYRSRRSAAPIGVLLSLYQRVRFGEHTPDAGEIAAARDALAVLVELWRADFPERRAPRVATMAVRS